MINYELLAALANMVPGQPLQLHPPEEDKPAIFVHICDDYGSDPVSSLFPNLAVSGMSPHTGSGIRIPQTQRPPVKCSASQEK